MILTSCSTISKPCDRYPLELEFPPFPRSQELKEDDGTVSMPFSYWKEIVDYRVEVYNIERTYLDWKEVYEKE